jgi:hypothetical protein
METLIDPTILISSIEEKLESFPLIKEEVLALIQINRLQAQEIANLVTQISELKNNGNNGKQLS